MMTGTERLLMLRPASKHMLTSGHLHVCQSHVLQALASLSRGGGGSMAREGGTVICTHLEQPEEAPGPSPAQKQGPRPLGRLSRAAQGEGSCSPCSSSAAKLMAMPRPPWSRPPWVSSLLSEVTSFDPNQLSTRRREAPCDRVHVGITPKTSPLTCERVRQSSLSMGHAGTPLVLAPAVVFRAVAGGASFPGEAGPMVPPGQALTFDATDPNEVIVRVCCRFGQA